jgi:hypothetical protein
VHSILRGQSAATRAIRLGSWAPARRAGAAGGRLTNAEIAARLVIAPPDAADHREVAILNKLSAHPQGSDGPQGCVGWASPAAVRRADDGGDLDDDARSAQGEATAAGVLEHGLHVSVS